MVRPSCRFGGLLLTYWAETVLLSPKEKDFPSSQEGICHFPEWSIRYTVFRIEGNRLDLELEKLHNCGRYDTVASYSFLLSI